MGPEPNVSVGKGIDAALGDIIRSLLMKPAEEAGSLLANGIGMLGDRVRRKREINAQLGMEEVRKKLDADSVDMRDITPPKEEELHLLVHGLSLTDDKNVRDMWAGLFAKALEPNSDVNAERPFISVLESLSPMDAKVIDFLAFTMKADRELRQNSTRFVPKDSAKITSEEKDKMRSIQQSNMELQKNAIQAIEEKAEEYGLKTISDLSWAENLMRQGVIERPQFQKQNLGSPAVRSLDERGISKVVEHLNMQLEHMEQTANRSSSTPGRLFSKDMFGRQIHLEVQLSSFGRRFAKACGVL
ncbi:hypothetical protein DDZ14_07300 [Maritimibacter sp. 55A14]|nr:hypothetical protein DDZ14_07300 [Maritimibacter sp. 55A14]